jgi:hypothetical protein
MGAERLELSRLIRSTDFKSAASTIPPRPQSFVILAQLESYLYPKSGNSQNPLANLAINDENAIWHCNKDNDEST